MYVRYDQLGIVNYRTIYSVLPLRSKKASRYVH